LLRYYLLIINIIAKIIIVLDLNTDRLSTIMKCIIDNALSSCHTTHCERELDSDCKLRIVNQPI